MREETWAEWLAACSEDPRSPAKIPPGSLGAITGQDSRALRAIDACWNLLAYCDDTGREAVLAAVRALLRAVQPQCRFFARELIARSLDWGDRDRYWQLVRVHPRLERIEAGAGAACGDGVGGHGCTLEKGHGGPHYNARTGQRFA